MEKNWICIYSTNKNHLAEIAKGILKEHDIESVIVNKKDSNYLFGLLELYVNRDHVIQGKHLLRDIEIPGT